MTTLLERDQVEARLDLLSAQVAFIADELAVQRQLRLQATELIHDLSPVAGAAMDLATSKFTVIDDKGYLEFLTQLMDVMDRVVTSFSPEDVHALGDNVVLILEAVKQMTQPEIMALLRRTAVSAQRVDSDVVNPPSMFGLARQLRDPDVRLGLARALSLLRTIGAEEQVDSPKE